MSKIGRTIWAIPEGYIPSHSKSSDRALVSHEAACILNAGDRTAELRIMVYFADRDPVGPYRMTVPARRTLHLRFNDLRDPAPVPRDTDYASVIEFRHYGNHDGIAGGQYPAIRLGTHAYGAAAAPGAGGGAARSDCRRHRPRGRKTAAGILDRPQHIEDNSRQRIAAAVSGSLSGSSRLRTAGDIKTGIPWA